MIYLVLTFFCLVFLMKKYSIGNIFFAIFCIPIIYFILPGLFIFITCLLIFTKGLSLINLCYCLPYVIFVMIKLFIENKNMKKISKYYENIGLYTKTVMDILNLNYEINLNTDEIKIDFYLENKKINSQVILSIEKEQEKELSIHIYDLRNDLNNMYNDINFNIMYIIKE